MYIAEWRKPSYREHSPARDAKEDILRELKAIVCPADPVDQYDPYTVADIGTGLGWFMEDLAESGYEPFGIDIAENCLDPGPKEKFRLVVCPISDIEEKADAATCIDVMEHIPEELVGPSLKAIANMVKCGAVFGISMVVDSGRLHCTVQDADWWKERLGEHFPNVARAEVTSQQPTAFGRHPSRWVLFRCWK